mgnify:CR=1 FL=1
MLNAVSINRKPLVITPTDPAALDLDAEGSGRANKHEIDLGPELA